jgi:hypothetical protein
MGSKGIAKPAYGRWVVPFHGDNVETHDVSGVGSVARREHRRRSYDLALFMSVNSVAGLREVRCCPVTDFYEYEALIVNHDQVDFATAAAKVARDGAQALPDEVIECRALRAGAYRSSCSTSHGESSAASGTMISPSLVKSWIGPP